MRREGQSRRSIRLRHYDYSQPGGYFLTLAAFQREHIFGEISHGEMILNEAGEIVLAAWEKLSERYPNVVADESVVMPNHFHGVLFILDSPVAAIHELPLRGNESLLRGDESPLRGNESPEEYRLRRRRMLLPRVVGYFKMNTAKAINLILNSSGVPVWQRNYYEHVIRTDQELDRIRSYIYYNPQQWEQDEENR